MHTEMLLGDMTLRIEESEDGACYLLTLLVGDCERAIFTLSAGDALVNWMHQSYVLCALPAQVHLLELECAAEPDEPGAGESPFAGEVPSWLSGPEPDESAGDDEDESTGLYYTPWGCCPECGKEGVYLNVHKDQFMVCHEHKVAWAMGHGNFSSWQHESPEVWERNRQLISTYRLLSEGEEWHKAVGCDEGVDREVWGDTLDDALKGFE